MVKAIVTESAYKLATRLPANSISVDVETRNVRVDDDKNITEQTCLQIRGTPEGSKWLSQLLLEKADAGNGSVIIADRDFAPVTMASFDAIELSCDSNLPDAFRGEK